MPKKYLRNRMELFISKKIGHKRSNLQCNWVQRFRIGYALFKLTRLFRNRKSHFIWLFPNHLIDQRCQMAYGANTRQTQSNRNSGSHIQSITQLYHSNRIKILTESKVQNILTNLKLTEVWRYSFQFVHDISTARCSIAFYTHSHFFQCENTAKMHPNQRNSHWSFRMGNCPTHRWLWNCYENSLQLRRSINSESNRSWIFQKSFKSKYGRSHGMYFQLNISLKLKLTFNRPFIGIVEGIFDCIQFAKTFPIFIPIVRFVDYWSINCVCNLKHF